VFVLDRQFLKEICYHLLFTFVVITATFLVGASVALLHRFPGMKLSLFLLVSGFSLLNGLIYILPMSMLITVVTVYGRAAADNEFTSIKAGGVHPYRLILPALLVATLVSGLSLHVSSTLAPQADYLGRKRLKDEGTLFSLFEAKIRQGVRSLTFDNFSLVWRKEELRSDGVRLEDLTLTVRNEDREKGLGLDSGVYLADRCDVTFLRNKGAVRFEFGAIKQVEGGGRAPLSGEGLCLTYEPRLGFSRQRLKHLTLPELMALRERAEEGYYLLYPRTSIDAQIHERIALSTSSVLFVLIGTPLALVFRSGNRLAAFLLSFVIGLFVYYPTILLSRTLGQQDVLPPILASWSGNLLMAVLGIGMLWFVVRR